MEPRGSKGWLTLFCVAAIAAESAWSGKDDGQLLKIFGLTATGRLISFKEDKPSDGTVIGTVSGLTGGETQLVGIDFRPATGALYGLGDSGGIYTVDKTTAVATFVAQTSVALDGTRFGIDFDPTTDRLRVISNTGQNLRVDVADGSTTEDPALHYAGTPGPATGVLGAAYTNNDADPGTGTTLFCIDSDLAQVVLQAPPDAGSLGPTGLLDAVSSHVTILDVGFDISSEIDGGETVRTMAFASLITGNPPAPAFVARLYRINLLTGKATLRGKFKNTQVVLDIAIPLDH